MERFFIADFYSHQDKVVIEKDGGIHKNQIEYDKIRSDIIEQKGIRVFRVNNEEIEKRLDDVLLKLKRYLDDEGYNITHPKSLS